VSLGLSPIRPRGRVPLLLLCAGSLCAQTLQQAETLRKARRFEEANEVFKALTEREPKNAEYRERWGRLYYDVGQEDEAANLFNEALGIDKNNARALAGLALIASETYESKAGELARRALAADPKLVEAQELLARLALEDNNEAKAAEEAKKALAIDPNSEQGKAILATIDWLADKKETPWDPHTAGGYATAGHFMTLNRRYDEAIAYYRKALELDPGLNRARSELGINLMRVGQDQEAYQQLETCFNNGFRDSATKNSLKLMDSYKNFVTFRNGQTILKLHKKEAELLRPYFEAEMERCIAAYEKKYRMKLEHPVQVEVYPDHEDFAVRTLGMPGLGALGVTFGYAIAMDSPSSRKPGSFHWGTTLWHEMSHVFTLTMTNHRVPRWFTEGVAVHEETAVSPEWGDRLGPDEIEAIKNHQLLPVAELDRGFIHPTRPQQVIVSYFQAGKICDYITAKWGWDTILAMLKDFGNDEDTASVIRKELKIEPAEFDKQFLAHLEAETKPTLDHFDEWKKRVKTLYELTQKKDWDGAIKEGAAIRDFYPDYVEEHSVYELLAQAYLAKGDKAAAMAELQRYVKAGGREPATLEQDAKLLREAGKQAEAAAVLERLNYIYPMDNEAHQQLGELDLALGKTAGAVREFHAVVAHSPIDPAQAHYELARAYQLNHQTDKAKDEVLAALETAPGYRQAQKLLLELSADTGTQPNTVKK
jgi:tetratricopeptide (TPR) repeat protein